MEGDRRARSGVLALQGGFAAHRRHLPDAVEVRRAEQVDGLDLLVLPGGESTTMLRLFETPEGRGIEEAVRRLVARGGTLFGTCAGAILLAKRVAGPEQPSWGLLDVDVLRNAYGRQVDSFEAELDPVPPGEPRIPAVFIRAPRLVRVGPAVTVLATLSRAEGQSEPVLVREGNVFAATFHPELTDDARVLALVRGATIRASS
jgi:5'-phosphate synthase pdxT subunit